MIKLGGINGNHSGHILETETIRLTDDFNPELNHHHILKHFQSIFSLGFSLTSLSLHHFFFFPGFFSSPSPLRFGMFQGSILFLSTIIFQSHDIKCSLVADDSKLYFQSRLLS